MIKDPFKSENDSTDTVSVRITGYEWDCPRCGMRREMWPEEYHEGQPLDCYVCGNSFDYSLVVN